MSPQLEHRHRQLQECLGGPVISLQLTHTLEDDWLCQPMMPEIHTRVTAKPGTLPARHVVGPSQMNLHAQCMLDGGHPL